jgi:hypothetical protein
MLGWDNCVLISFALDRLTGFLLGSVLSGAGMYYYVLNEYRVSNELLTEDIFVSLGRSFNAVLIANLITGLASHRSEDRGIFKGAGRQD